MPEQRSRPRDGRVIALANQKGGTGKTTTTVNLGIGLARLGKKVLLIDADPQGDLTTCLGWQNQDSLSTTLATVMEKVIRDEPFTTDEGILHHSEGVDLMPANIELSALEMSLVNAMSREFTLRTYVNEAKKHYDVVLIDCMPSLGMITINALAAADSVIIPVQAHYLPAKGMTQLMKTIGKVKRQINPALKVDGVLLTLVDGRTNLARQTADTLRQSYGNVLKIYRSEIPVAIKAAEISAAGKSIYAYDKGSKVAQAYADFSKEVLADGEKQRANEISSSTSTQTETVIETSDDGNGNIVETETTVTQTYLYITVSHKTAEEMANQFGFNEDQREQMAELLADENNSLWSQVLYGITGGDGEIVTVALSQVGNVGGEPYWSWYGFGSRVEWCACFVSWCANECGYIEAGVIPKFAACASQGVPWFQERGLWQDNSYEPRPGDIIFFDWDDGGQDGSSDHVGIVEKVENGRVYTVEGNSGDSVRQNSYPVGYYEIYGYGTPAC